MKRARAPQKLKRGITQLVREKKSYFLHRLRYPIDEPLENLETMGVSLL